jgi:hypothetical protein
LTGYSAGRQTVNSPTIEEDILSLGDLAAGSRGGDMSTIGR